MLGATTSIASGGQPGTAEYARKQAQDLESVFINTLMKQMFSSVKTSADAFGGGFAEETWRGMQAEQLAAAVAESGGLGIADAIAGDLFAAQQAAGTTNPMQGKRQ